MTRASDELFGLEGKGGLGSDRPDEEQITVWHPDRENKVHVWFETEEGEAAFDLTADERRALIVLLSKGLE